MNRLTSLCSLHGVGLVTFSLNKELPDYTVFVQPAVAAPDRFYVNSVLDRLKSSEPALLNNCFRHRHFVKLVARLIDRPHEQALAEPLSMEWPRGR